MKKLKWISLLFVMALGFSVFAACSDGGETFTVTFYGRDGETVIKTVEVEEGEKVEEWTPTEDGWKFVKWSATPNLKRPFPFDDPITQDMSVFSSWKSAVFEADTREWILVGESMYVGSLLSTSNWGKVSGDARTPYKFTKADKEEVNEYTLTADFYPGDNFQIADVDVENNYAFTNQRGYGYLDINVPGLMDMVSDAGNVYEDNTNKSNIEIVKKGNYTIKFTTELSNTTLDTITLIRNSDPLVDLKLEYKPSLAGSMTGGAALTGDSSAWGDLYLKETSAAGAELKTFETTVSLNKGDFFAVLPFENSWSTALRTDKVTGDSDKCYDEEEASNITITESAKYKITLRVVETEGMYKEADVTIKKVGEFEPGANDNKITFTNGEDVTTVYVRKGARVPDPGEPVAPEGKKFIGWYSDLEKNIPMAFNKPLATEKAEISCVPKFMSETDKDTRDIYVRGDFNGWKNDPAYKMTSDGKHTYTLDITITDIAKASCMLVFFEGENDTGLTANGEWGNKEGSAAEVGGLGENKNISFTALGTYTITVDTYNETITIVKK